MCLMDSYINIDNEFVKKKPRDISDEMNTGNVSEFMLCEIMFIQNNNQCLQ